MRATIYITNICLVLLCSCSQGFKTIEYKRVKNQSNEKNIRYNLNIPKGFKVITSRNEHELEKRYIYKDSIIIYISDYAYSKLTKNYILSLGDSVSKKRFEDIEFNSKIRNSVGLDYKYEDMVLEGKNSKGFYWKDMRIGFISIGYINVPEKRKISFDNALNSFKVLSN